jgi:hypothetical protein
VRQQLVACPYFELEYVRQAEPFEIPGGQLRALIGLHGHGWVDSGAGRTRIERGTTLLLPAGLKMVQCQPEGSLGVLVATLPE